MPAELHEPRALAEVDERIEALSSSGWRADPAQLLRLLVGLWLFGAGEALLVVAELGNSPWTVFAGRRRGADRLEHRHRDDRDELLHPARCGSRCASGRASARC